MANTEQQATPTITAAQHYAMTKSVNTIVSDLNSSKGWLVVAAIGAFIASAMCTVKYFVGGNLDMGTWNGETWINAGIGLVIAAIVTAFQMKLYSSGRKGLAAGIGIFIVVFFGLFTEITQGMERGDQIVRDRSTESGVYKAAVAAIGTASTQAPTLSGAATRAVQHAQGLVGKYQAQLDSKNACNSCVKRKFHEIRADLIAAQAKLAEAKARADLEVQAGAAASGAAVTNAIAQAKALEFNEENQYAMIRLIKTIFNITAIWASFIFTLIMIGTFEYAFWWIGCYVADHKEALKMIGRGETGEVLKEEVVAAEEVNIPPAPTETTKPKAKTADIKPSDVVPDLANTPINATYMQTANLDRVHPYFQKSENAYSSFGNNSAPSFGTSPKATMPTATAPKMTMGNLALQPEDNPVNEVQIDLEELVTPGKMNKPNLALVKNDRPTPASQQSTEKAEKNLDETLSSRLPDLDDKVENKVKEQGAEQGAEDEKGYTSAEFLAVLKAIDQGMNRFSFASVGKVLKAECKVSGDSDVIRPKVELLADGFIKEGMVIANPKFEYNEETGKGNGVSKWLINPDYERQPNRWK